jgi:hypothetical protein
MMEFFHETNTMRFSKTWFAVLVLLVVLLAVVFFQGPLTQEQAIDEIVKMGGRITIEVHPTNAYLVSWMARILSWKNSWSL